MEKGIPEELVLTPEERNALPERTQQYLSALEAKLDSYRQTLDTVKDELRRKRFSHWNRAR